MTDLRKLLDEATPGPWVCHFGDDSTTCDCRYVLGEYGGMGSLATIDVAKENYRPWGDDNGPCVEVSKANARLIAMAPDLAAALLKAEEALEDISRQKKTDELETEYEAECADFEAGFDTCVDVARATLTEIRKFTGAA
jgi:hypothetical protein